MPLLDALARRMWDRRQTPEVGAAGLGLVFVLAWIVKDLLAGTTLLHAVVAGVLLGVVAGVLYWIALRALRAVGHQDDDGSDGV